MKHQLPNKYFWYALTLVAFVGGLVLGQFGNVLDDLDQAASSAAASIYSEEFIELRNLDTETKALNQESLEADFSEVDRELLELK